MRAVNLVPPEFRPREPGSGDPRIAYGVVGGLALLLVMVIVAISYSNKLKTIQDETAALEAKANAAQATVSAVAVTPDKVGAEVKSRTLLVGGLATTRFPWGDALYNLSESLPEDVTLDTITAVTVGDTTAAANQQSGAAAVASGSQAKLTIEGCTSGWIGYSRFMTWLKEMPGVQKVKSNQSAVGAATPGAEGEVARNKNCGPAPLTFGLEVVYEPRKVNLVGLPKPDVAPAAAGASGSTGAAPAAPSAPDAAPEPAAASTGGG